jgi:hypothetical protein
LLAGQSCTFSVSFQATSVGLNQVAVNVPVVSGTASSNAGQGALVSGLGVAPAGTLVAPAGLNGNFGNQLANTRSAARIFTYANAGVGPLSIANVQVTGADSAAFQIANNGCAGGVVLLPATSCQIAVVFAPTSSGVSNAQLSVSGTVNRAINLSGRGVVAAVVALSTGPLVNDTVSFPLTSLGRNSATQTIRLSNPAGNPTLTGVSYSLGGADASAFQRTGGSCGTAATPSNLGAGASCTVILRFSPPTAANGGSTGAKAASLSFSSTSTVGIPLPVPVVLTGLAN